MARNMKSDALVFYAAILGLLLALGRVLVAEEGSVASRIDVPLFSYGVSSSNLATVRIYFSKNEVEVSWITSERAGKCCRSWLSLSREGQILRLDTEREVPTKQGGNFLGALTGLLACKDLLTNSVAYWCDPIGKTLVRAFPCHYESVTQGWVVAEMLSLDKQPTVVWSKKVESLSQPLLVARISFHGTHGVLIAFRGTDALILGANDGNLVARFTYGTTTTREEARERKRRFRLKFADTDPALRFWASYVALAEQEKILAAGCAHDQRIRIVSLEPPFPMVAELNADKNPQEPRGGTWRVQRLEFSPSGNYLIAEYFFAGRGTRRVLRPTEIYETHGWKKVWETNDPTIYAVSLSPDDSQMAFIKDNCLKIVPFQPSLN